MVRHIMRPFLDRLTTVGLGRYAQGDTGGFFYGLSLLFFLLRDRGEHPAEYGAQRRLAEREILIKIKP